MFLPDARYCYTRHMMDNHGDSVSVTKRCVALEDCLFTGCAHVTDNGYQVCGTSGLNCIKVHNLILISWKTERSQIILCNLDVFSTFKCRPSGVLILLRGEHLQRAGAEKWERRHFLLNVSSGQLEQRASSCSAELHHRHHHHHLHSWTCLRGKLCICARSSKTSW